MIELSKVYEILNATQGLAQAQAQVNVSQQGQVGQAQQQAQGGDPKAEYSSLFAKLGEVLNTANTQSAQPNQQQAELQRQAALVTARVNALVSKANRLESELNLAPTPDKVSVDDLFAEFKEIMKQLDKDMGDLHKQINQKKEENKLDLKQKPTAMKAGEHVGDASFNQTLTLQ